MALCEYIYEGKTIGNIGYVYRCRKDNRICRAAHLPGIEDLFMGRIGYVDISQVDSCEQRKEFFETKPFLM